MTTPTIDLTPTPAGLKHMRQVFLADAKRARENAERAEEMENTIGNKREGWGGMNLRLSENEALLLEKALQVFWQHEYERAEQLEAGAAECLPGAVTVIHVNGGAHTPVTNAEWTTRAREAFLNTASNPEHQPLYFPVNATGPVWTGATFVFPGCECIKVEA